MMGTVALQKVSVERSGRKLVADIDLGLEPGRVTVLIGPNGAGKSTVLKVASGVWPATKGIATLDGVDIRTLSPRTLAARRALVAQGASLAFPFTVAEVVMLGATVPGFGLDTNPATAVGALAAVDLIDFADRSYLELSGGERQRVHIARALCQLQAGRRPGGPSQVLLLDEPTASLDPAHQTHLMALCRELAASGLTVVLVLHDLNLAAAWADTLVVLAKGRVRAVGSPQDVLTDELLRSVYDWSARVNERPAEGDVFVLPHHARDMAGKGGTSAAMRH